jgi:hypothetical protein
VPRYRFQVKDEAGRLRTGSLEAETLEAARKQILSRGFEVVALQALAATVAAAASDELSLEPEQPTPTRSKLDVVMLLLGLLGLLGCLHQVLRPSAQRSAVQPHVACSVQVEGTLQMAGAREYSDVQMVLDFPEVPVQWTRGWRAVSTQRAGEFRLIADFESPSAPHTCRFIVRKPGYREYSQDLPLAGLNARFERSVALQRL